MRALRPLLAGLILAVCTACGPGGEFDVDSTPSEPGILGAPAAQIMFDRFTTYTYFGVARFRGQGADPEGGPLGYSRDFDGDGIVDDTGPVGEFLFPTSARYEVTLTVTDASGLSSTASAMLQPGVFNTDPAIEPLVAVQAFTLLGEHDMEFFFRAPAMLGPATYTAAAAGYEWDFEDDGTIDLTTSQPFATKVYGTPGTRTCRVRVVDLDGDSGEATVTVAACHDSGYPLTSPGAMISQFTGGPAFQAYVTPSIPALLIAHGADPNAGPNAITWDLDGDGVFDDGIGRQALFLPTPGPSGNEVRMRITDGSGQFSDAMCTVRTSAG